MWAEEHICAAALFGKWTAAEDVHITKNDKAVIKRSNPHQDKVSIAKSLFGILPTNNVTLGEAKVERLNRI